MEENALIDRYVKWLESLNAQGAHRISQFVSRDVRHRTPEAEALGAEGSAALYGQIFDRGAQVRTKVLAHYMAADGFTHILRWDRLVTPAQGPKWSLSGYTEATVNTHGKIMSIVDYWDGTPPAAPRKNLLQVLFKR